MFTFRDRIRHRKDVWWAVPGGLRNPSAWRRPLHRVLDTHQLRHRDWPLARWHCCAAWQRCLSNKYNSREFAAMHGVALPELYWCGRNLGRFPVNEMPSRAAVRYAWGAGSDQTHLLVDGHELLDDRACTPQELYSGLCRQYGRWTVHPLLVEEFLEDSEGRPRATQFNFYCFSGYVGMVEHVDHVGRTSHRTAYDIEWNPFSQGIYAKRPLGDIVARPFEMDEMLEVASRLGAAYGAFVRVDLYLTNKGVYFGEFSSTPFNGNHILPWADKLLGQMWEEHCPHYV
jgi:hypothetical protein